MISIIVIGVVYLIIFTIFVYKFFDTGEYKYFALLIGTYALCAITYVTMATLGLGYNS